MQNNKKRISIAKILMILGVLLILFGVGYEAINYPWGYQNASLDANQMPLPKPIKGGSVSFYEEDFEHLSKPSTLPSSDQKTPLSRPNISIVRLGTLKIPRIGLTENIVEGSNEEILYGVGHVSGTNLPHEDGNFVLAGHRNYVWMHPFRHLDKLQIGDTVQVEIDGPDHTTTYVYEIYKQDTVSPEDISVMETQSDNKQVVTLITCTPLWSYSHRMVYWGKLVDTIEQ